ncbi:MAG: efflux RND transporter periplasmic adaptor subunit [Dehalococcoidia bacterium]
MKTLLTLLALAGVSAAVFALGSFRRDSDDKPLLHVAKEIPVTVEVAKPERKEIIRWMQTPGDVEAVLEVEVSSEIVAKIEEMPVEEGDLVSPGDLLCRLSDDNLKAEVQSGEARVGRLRAGIMQADADLEKAQRDCQRQARLSEVEATTDKERFDYLIVRKKAEAVLEMRTQELAEAEAQAYLTRVNEDLKRTIIESPISGIISKINAKQGEVVVTGTMNNPGTVIMTISDLSRMQVRARVDEVDIPLVQFGQEAKVFLQSDQQVPVPAKVVRVASKGTRMLGRDVVFFEALLEVLSHDPRIKPAMTANVEIKVAEHEDAITVPVEAIVHRMRKDLSEEIAKQFDAKQAQLDVSERARQAQYLKVVYVKDGDVAKVRLIEPGIADTHRVELLEGVGMDDLVIIGPYRSLDQLKNDKKVALAEDDKKKLEEQKAGEDAEAEQKLADAEGDDGDVKDDSANQDGDGAESESEEGDGERAVAASTSS